MWKIHTMEFYVSQIHQEDALMIELELTRLDNNWNYLMAEGKENKMISKIVPEGTIMGPGETIVRFSNGDTILVPPGKYIVVYPFSNLGDPVKSTDYLGICIYITSIAFLFLRFLQHQKKKENEEFDNNLLVIKKKKQKIQKIREKLDDLSKSMSRERGRSIFSFCSKSQ